MASGAHFRQGSVRRQHVAEWLTLYAFKLETRGWLRSVPHCSHTIFLLHAPPRHTETVQSQIINAFPHHSTHNDLPTTQQPNHAAAVLCHACIILPGK
mmetsp:Transcript_68687/g.109928  ORF Transcript_68687/g.109928 Transcript_68687/m.109928 type:complete len:98 (+) Transcript_68687:112-405(+)